MSKSDFNEIESVKVDAYILEDKCHAFPKSLKTDDAAKTEKDCLKDIFSRFIMDLTKIWLAFIMFMVFFTSTGFIHLSDTVLVALIAGTTVNIIGLVVIVAKHLFPSGDKTKCRNYEE